MTPDEIIELLQGVKAGRKWGIRFRSSGDLVEQASQEAESLCRCIVANDVERVELLPLPDEITIPARVIPAPLREAPKDGTVVFLVDPFEESGLNETYFYSRDADHLMWLKRGFFFDTEEKAAIASKAMCPYA